MNETVDVLTEVVRIGVEFKHRQEFFDPQSGKRPADVASEVMPEFGLGIDAALESLKTEYLPGMPNFGSVNFLGFPDAGNSLAGISGAILADLLNVNMINGTFCSRIATEMEIAVISWLRQLIGYETSADAFGSALDVGGMALPGGTSSNYAALLLARERAFPGTMRRGVRFDPAQVAVLVPDTIGHYTIPAAMAWAGLGADQVHRIPVTDFRYDRKALRRALSRLRRDGVTPVMGVVYAGDSRSLTVDALSDVARVFHEEVPEIWLHCDGCHGTSLLFSSRSRHKLDGIADYDSVTLDPHKVLNVPYPTSFLLVREPARLATISSSSDLIMRQASSLGQTTPAVGSKPFFSLRLWLLFKTIGREGIGQLIEDRLEQARKFAELVEEDSRFVVLNEVNINSVVFAYLPSDVELPLASEDDLRRVAHVNRALYAALLEDGKLYLHSFKITDNRNELGRGSDAELDVLRYMSGNPLLGADHMRSILDSVAGVGMRMANTPVDCDA